MPAPKKIFAVMLLALLAGGAAQASSKTWLHVRVEEGGKKREKVKVNIPLSLAESVIPLIQENELARGKLRIPHHKVKVEDLRKVWETLRAQGDAEYVTVESEDGKIRVLVRGNYLFIQSEESSKDQIQVQIPLQVVDAMFSGQGDELDLLAAIKALQQSGVRDIISIKSDHSTVLVWIDDKNTDQ